MSLDGALLIASGGLANINRDLAVVSQNVANASTAGYSREISTQSSLTADGQPMGVRTGTVNRAIDAQLQQMVNDQAGSVAGLTAAQSALQRIDAVQGTVGAGSDLSSLLGKLQDAFTALQTDPGDQTQQAAVVVAAQSLAGQLNTVSTATGAGRQTAQDAIVSEVGQLNTALSGIGSLSTQIVTLRADGQSTADLENQRDAAIATVSQLVGARFLEQPDGDVIGVTSSGLSLPVHGGAQFATQEVTIGASSTYPGGGIPGITLADTDVTSQLGGGQLGAQIALRDTTLPTFQAQTDEFAETLSTRFSAQGLTLFSQPDGSVPAGGGSPVQSGYVGYAGTIGVNPAVLATPSLVRDGTGSVAGSASGASAFTPNPVGGPAGSATLVDRIVDFALGAQVQDGVAQPVPATIGLGAAGTLSAGYAAPTDLAGLSAAVVAAQSQTSGDTTAELATATGVQTALQSQASSQGGVNIDQEMSSLVELQNAYGANARIISAVQTLWTQLLAIVN